LQQHLALTSGSSATAVCDATRLALLSLFAQTLVML
jgi:hypothetical protein